MSYVMKTNIANKGNYGSVRNTSKIKYIVIHYTANDGDTDESNGRYFHNNVVKASAHYFVDSDSITQSVPDNYVAWSVGGKKYSNCASTGGGKYYGQCTNTNSISIELCDDVKNGAVYPSAATIENALALTKILMSRYSVPVERVIRHFDVTGKPCPSYWCGTAEKNALWATAFHNKLTSDTADINAALDKLVGAGIINTKEYWLNHHADLPYIDRLICNMADYTPKLKTASTSVRDVNSALNKFVSAGIINTKEYWLANYSKVLYLDTLIIRFAERIPV